MAEKRIPAAKPTAELTELYTQQPLVPDGDKVTRFETRFGKIFERVESPLRGVSWFQVVQQ